MRDAICGFRDELICGIEDKIIEERKVKSLHLKVQAVAMINMESG